jgi:hypothetical protein
MLNTAVIYIFWVFNTTVNYPGSNVNYHGIYDYYHGQRYKTFYNGYLLPFYGNHGGNIVS